MKKNYTGEASLKLQDVVALLNDIPNERLVKGQVGTVVEALDEGVYEIEFADKQGRTLASLALLDSELMLLHFEPETVV